MSGAVKDQDLHLPCVCGCNGYRHCPHCAGCLDHPECSEFDRPKDATT